MISHASPWTDLVVVDVEGNGASPPDLIEVATLPVRNGQLDLHSAGHWLIRPPRPVTPQASRVHGLTTAALSQHPPWSAVAAEVQQHLSDAWICAHHAHTEHRVLTAHLPTWQPAGVLDTLRLAKTTYPQAGTYSLDSLIDYAGIDLTDAPGHRHRATYDAYATAQLLLAMAGHYSSFDALAAAAVPPGLPGAPAAPEQESLW